MKLPQIAFAAGTVLLAGCIGVGIGRVWQWYLDPLAAPLCIGIGADAVQAAVDQFYQTFWLRWLAIGLAVTDIPLWIIAVVLLKRSKAS